MKKALQVFFAFLLAVGVLFSGPFIHQVAAKSIYHQKSAEQVLKETKQAAVKGKVINSEFGLGSTKAAILKKYGKPGTKSSATYLDYPKRHVAFALKNNKVIRIFTKDPDLLKVKQSQVIKVLGKPSRTEGAAGHIYWTYKLGKNELVFNWQNVSPNVGKLIDVTVQKAEQ